MKSTYGVVQALAKRRTLAVVSALVALSFIVAPATRASAAPQHEATSSTAANQGSYIGVTGVNFTRGKRYTLAEVQAMQAKAAKRTTQSSSTSPSSKPGQITPFSVASGFVLYDPGYRRTDYVYDSDWGPATEIYCETQTDCVATDEWQTQVHEYLNGGSSKLWQLTLNARRVYGTDTVTFDWWYACAINVSGSPDHYCAVANGADPSPQSLPMNPGETLYKYFERNSYSNIEYPMVAIGVQYSHVYVQDKYRGWDACVSASNTKLCASSGNGS